MLDSRTKNLENQIIGKWEVIKFHGYINRNAFWECKCQCGLIKPVKAQYLLSDTSRSCSKCANPRDTIENAIPPKIWGYIVSRAKRKNHELNISREYAYELFVKQNYKCALTGLVLYMPKNASEYLERKGTASLDRINNNEGYIIGNVQWIHKDLNRMKNIFAQDYFVRICGLVTDHLSAKSSSVGPVLIP